MHQYPEYVHEGGQYVSRGTGMTIAWQEGPFVTVGLNGSMPEQPVRALLHRIGDLDSRMPCPQNKEIVGHLTASPGNADPRRTGQQAPQTACKSGPRSTAAPPPPS
jgi:hypothetical protein